MVLFKRGDYLFSFDLKSGYHHVDIAKHHWKYLGFNWEGMNYVFTILPFGLSTTCYIFTKIVPAHWSVIGELEACAYWFTWMMVSVQCLGNSQP